MAYENLAKDILKHIGGKENIASLTHCITRLRFKLKDESKADTEKIKGLTGVITVMQSAGQYQVVIGNHVPEVYQVFLNVAGISEDSMSGNQEKQKGNPLDRFIDIISGIFQPILGVLIATGMIKGLLSMCLSFGWIEETSGTYIALYAVADSVFNFLPIFLGFTAAKKFGMNQFVGVAIGAAFVHPILATVSTLGDPIMTLFQGTAIESNVFATFLGIPLIIPMSTYTATVIPIILTIAIAAPFERWVKTVIPSVLRAFFVPFFTLVIIFPLALLVIGPIATWIGALLGEGFANLYELSPAITGLLLGGLWQVLVIFGLHWGLVPVAFVNLATLGYDPILTLTFAASFAQTGAVLAVMLKTKNKKLKALGIPAFISGIFGITEPAIYGITLPRKRVFIASCLAAAMGGMLLGLFKVKGFVLGGTGIFGYPSVVKPDGSESYLVAMILITLASLVLGTVLAYFMYDSTKDDLDQELEDKKDQKQLANKDNVIYSPLKGDIIPLKDVNDQAFSSEAIGKGLAILPTEGKLFAPADGTISALFETLHAVGIACDDGPEVLMHIGMDTVQLKGEFFKGHVAQGDRVKKGDLLVEFDITAITQAGYSIVTPIVVTNTDQYLDVTSVAVNAVTVGDELVYTISDNL